MRGCPPEGEEYPNYGNYVQKLTVKKINNVVFCIRKTLKHKKKIIDIDQWRPTTISNFFCSTYSYLSRGFSRETQGQMPEQGQRWYPKMTILHFKRRVLWPDESRINPLKSRRFQEDFKMILRIQDGPLQKTGPLAGWGKDQPA